MTLEITNCDFKLIVYTCKVIHYSFIIIYFIKMYCEIEKKIFFFQFLGGT